MLAANRGRTNNFIEGSNDKNVRTRIYHFHPSTCTRDNNGKHTLKIGVAPTAYLRKISMVNDAHKEDERTYRIVGSAEDISHTHEHQMKKIEVNAAPVTVIPTIDQRNNKRRDERFLFEEASKLAYIEKHHLELEFIA